MKNRPITDSSGALSRSRFPDAFVSPADLNNSEKCAEIFKNKDLSGGAPLHYSPSGDIFLSAKKIARRTGPLVSVSRRSASEKSKLLSALMRFPAIANRPNEVTERNSPPERNPENELRASGRLISSKLAQNSFEIICARPAKSIGRRGNQAELNFAPPERH